ncbi:uncharacterized protein LOC129911679 [Episyrphus balteatus]|uniref:uncharacterized protein LOC129911679 n=1 Tax=Episyrphus balteatus TaxID=286459 RepID=UPI00248641C5|nr:uncharacterized protein LOC129911679 [Episyrphus balteatus]
MADLDCRIVAMLGLALSLLSLSGLIFVRHHQHHAYYHSPEAFVTERECLPCDDNKSTSSKSDSGTTGIEFGSDSNPPTNLITTPHDASNETSSHSSDGGAFDVSEACLQCICETSSGCVTAKCSSGLECGIFRISQPYWIDAGSPTLKGGIYENDDDEESTDSKKAYLQCVNNPFCAARAVKGYIGRYIRDCDSDGIIDCYDYAAIHVQGPTGCKLEELSPTSFGRLYRCLNDLTVKRRADAA